MRYSLIAWDAGTLKLLLPHNSHLALTQSKLQRHSITTLSYNYLEIYRSGRAFIMVHITYHCVTLLSVQVLFILMIEFVKNSGYHRKCCSV